MTPTAIFACDPGLRSGWASWTEEDGTITSEIADPMETCEVLDNWLRTYRNARREVVFEAYQITTATAQKSQQHYSLELIGAGRWLAHQHGATFVDPLQKPSEAKRFCPDQRLRDLGLWASGGPDHERDALRHLVMRLAKHRLIRLSPLGGV